MVPTKTRIRSVLLTFCAMGCLGLFVGSNSARAEGEVDNSCKAKVFKFDVVKKLCADPSKGKKAVKKLMKNQVVKKAKAAGEKMNCKSCHDNTKTFTLKKNAEADLKKWLG